MALNLSGSCYPYLIKMPLGLISLCIAGYLLGPPLYWHFVGGLAAVSDSSSSSSCSSFRCDCSYQHVFSVPEDFAKNDSEVNADSKKNVIELMSEELKLQEAESLESQQRVAWLF